MAHKYSDERNAWVQQELHKKLTELIEQTSRLGFVLRVDTSIDPLRPQDGVTMTSEIRPARGNY
jgi:hypothetical protein